jgi:putative endonuclease
MPLFLQPQKGREFSSAGSEHLPYKQRVGGSIPSTPTKYKGSGENWNLFLYVGFLYFIFCNPKQYYLGHTGDKLEERLRKHNSHHKGFTGGKADWKVVHTELFETKEDSYRRERQVKNWKSRRLIEALWFRASRLTVGRVSGSIPSTPTKKPGVSTGFFYFLKSMQIYLD